MKKFLFSILSVLMLCMPFMFSGCIITNSPSSVKREENGFYYCYINDDDLVRNKIKATGTVIVGLTKEMQCTKELIIPEKLGGVMF